MVEQPSKWLIVALVALVGGCASGRAPFEIGPGFTDADTSAILSAWAAWEDAGATMPERMTFVHVDDDVSLPEPNMVGYTSSDRTHIYLKHRENAAVSTDAALHEIGHAIGLQHTAEVGIMFFAVDGLTRIQPSDMVECRRVGACPK